MLMGGWNPYSSRCPVAASAGAPGSIANRGRGSSLSGKILLRLREIRPTLAPRAPDAGPVVPRVDERRPTKGTFPADALAMQRTLVLLPLLVGLVRPAPLRGGRTQSLLETEAGAEAGELPCLNDCSGALGKRGSCIKGVCVCDDGFFGPDCSLTNRADLPGSGGLLAQRPAPFFNASKAPLDAGATCEDALCASVCTYGGLCQDARTCLCRLDRGNSTHEPEDADDRPPAPESPQPLAREEYDAVMAVFDALGAPVAPGDPCTNWRQWPAVRCSIDGHVVGIDLGRRKLTGTCVSQPDCRAVPAPPSLTLSVQHLLPDRQAPLLARPHAEQQRLEGLHPRRAVLHPGP